MKIPEKIDVSFVHPPSTSELAKNIAELLVSTQKVAKETDSSSSAESILQRAMIDNVNQVWRIYTAIFDSESREVKDQVAHQEVKKIANAVDKLVATFESLGLRIIDRLGEPFDAGFPDQVITEEQREGLTKEQIIRTIRPTILWNQTMVQRGEIDIAVPIIKK